MNPTSNAEDPAQDRPRAGLLASIFVRLCPAPKTGKFLNALQPKWPGKNNPYEAFVKLPSGGIPAHVGFVYSGKTTHYHFRSGRGSSGPPLIKNGEKFWPAQDTDLARVYHHLLNIDENLLNTDEKSIIDTTETERALLLTLIKDTWNVLTFDTVKDLLQTDSIRPFKWNEEGLRARAVEAVKWTRKYLPSDPAPCPHTLDTDNTYYKGTLNFYLDALGYEHKRSSRLLRYPAHFAFWHLVMGGHCNPPKFLKDTNSSLHEYTSRILYLIIQSLLPITTLGTRPKQTLGSRRGQAYNARPLIRHYVCALLKGVHILDPVAREVSAAATAELSDRDKFHRLHRGIADAAAPVRDDDGSISDKVGPALSEGLFSAIASRHVDYTADGKCIFCDILRQIDPEGAA